MPIFAFMFKVKPVFGSPDYGVAASGYACIYVCDDVPKRAVDKALQCIKDAGYRYIRTEKSGEAEITDSTPEEQRALMAKAERHGMSSCFVMARDKPGLN